MRPILRLVYPLALGGLLAALAGCGSGSAQGPVSTASSPAAAQVASAVFVQQWGQILWGLVTSQTGTQDPSFGDPVLNPDGSFTQSYVGADGTTVTITGFPDGSARLEIAYPDGTTETVSQSVPEFDSVSKTTIHWVVASSTGLSVAYTSVVDNQGTIFDISDDTTELQGVATLPGHLTQQFTALSAAGQTEVHAQQSDGSTFTMTVPLAAPEYALPDFSQPATGTYSRSGARVDFTLTSTADAPTRWAAMASDLSGGMAGQFSLSADFSGSGQLAENGEPVAILSWTRTGETAISYLTAESSDASPAGAAIDFLLHRWQTLTALLAPAPGLSAPRSVGQAGAYRTRISPPR